MISFSPGTWWISRRVWTLRLFWARDLTNWGLNRKMAPSCGSELKKKKITVTVLSAGSNPVSMCYPGTKRGFARDEGALLLRQKKKKGPTWALGRCRQRTEAELWAKTLQGQAGRPAASLEARVQLHGATLHPKVHIRAAWRAYILFLDLALCQNHRVRCLHGLQRKDSKCDLAQAVMTIYC